MWTSGCLENCMKRLTGLNKPFKYVVTCIIMQKTGEGPRSSQHYDAICSIANLVCWKQQIVVLYGRHMSAA